MARRCDQTSAGSDSAGCQVTAQFNAMGAAAFSRHGVVDRFHANFQNQTVLHSLGPARAGCWGWPTPGPALLRVRTPSKSILCRHLNDSRIPQTPQARLQMLRKRPTGAEIDGDQRAEVAGLEVALDAATTIGSPVDIGVPERENIEDFQAILEVLTFGDGERLRKGDVAPHEVRLANAVAVYVSILISCGRGISGGVEPVENVALEIRLRVHGGIQHAKDRRIGISHLVGAAQVGAHPVFAVTAQTREQGLGHARRNRVDSAEFPPTQNPVSWTERPLRARAHRELIGAASDEAVGL